MDLLSCAQRTFTIILLQARTRGRPAIQAYKRNIVQSHLLKCMEAFVFAGLWCNLEIHLLRRIWITSPWATVMTSRSQSLTPWAPWLDCLVSCERQSIPGSHRRVARFWPTPSDCCTRSAKFSRFFLGKLEFHVISIIVIQDLARSAWKIAGVAQGVFASSELAPFELGVSPGMEVSKPSIGKNQNQTGFKFQSHDVMMLKCF